MYYTYLLRSKKDNHWYTGTTGNLRERFRLHNKGEVFSTKDRRPFELIYYEACIDKKDAYIREKYLKSGMGKRYLKNRLKRSLSLTGFTLTEILVVVGIFALLMSFSLVVSLDIYRGDSFRAEQDFVISILQKARSQSINNINETSHGIRF